MTIVNLSINKCARLLRRYYMKRNVFEYSSSDSETEAPSKKIKPFIRPENLKLHSPAANSASAGVEQDYNDIKLEETVPHQLETATKPEDTSILKNGSIGLSMMQKMGFKVGQTLGTGDSGLAEPISVEVKKGRAGIGATRKLPKGTQITPATIDSFLSHSKLKAEEQRDLLYLWKLQKYCFQESGEDMEFLDGKILVQEVNEMWRSYAVKTFCKKSGRVKLFGSTVDEEKVESDETLDFDKEPLRSQLLRLISYSRENYLYCPYCGIKFDSKEDMQGNCPGPYDHDHER